MVVNRFGLNRNIPQNIQREVRRRCGFGCIICGCAIYQYEHFDPPFVDCRKHTIEGITLLCGSHQDKKTRGFLPLEVIINANQKPVAKTKGFWDQFHLGSKYPSILLGSNELFNCHDIIMIDGNSILRIDSPEIKDSPFRLSGRFFNYEGDEYLTIKENEWQGNPACWDVTTKGGLITVKSTQHKPEILVEISVKDLPSRIVFSKLNMQYQGYKFYIDKDGIFKLVNPNVVQSSYTTLLLISIR
jgi:hypothetical protein